MSLRYSPSTGGFYDTDLHAEIPDDGVYVSPARHAELMAAQAEGAAIVASPDTGNPVTETLPDNLDTRRAGVIVAVKREAARRIAAVMPVHRQLNALRAGPSAADAAGFAAIDAIRAASDAIEAELTRAAADDLAAFDLASHPAWPKD